MLELETLEITGIPSWSLSLHPIFNPRHAHGDHVLVAAVPWALAARCQDEAAFLASVIDAFEGSAPDALGSSLPQGPYRIDIAHNCHTLPDVLSGIGEVNLDVAAEAINAGVRELLHRLDCVPAHVNKYRHIGLILHVRTDPLRPGKGIISVHVR